MSHFEGHTVGFPIYPDIPFFSYSISAEGRVFNLSFEHSSITDGFSVTIALHGSVIVYCVPVNPWVNLFRGTSFDGIEQLYLFGAQPTLKNFGLESYLLYGRGAIIG